MNSFVSQYWSASKVLRVLLTFLFLSWLITLLIQYPQKNDKTPPQKINQQAPAKIILKQLTLPALPITSNKKQESGASELKDTRSPNVEDASLIEKQQVEQVYQRLTDEGVDIQIAWPQKAKEQQATLDFMYQCADMQFAVLNDNRITKVNQLALNDYSDWIRVAQGNLSKKESAWIRAYALKGKSIRLFPRHIDLRLAQHLAMTLKGEPLTKLRANYQVNNGDLYLTHIRLNGQLLNGNWMLYQSNC